MAKRLRILAGPNGSGKSTIIFDNSAASYKWIAEYDGKSGLISYKTSEIPTWVDYYINRPNYLA